MIDPADFCLKMWQLQGIDGAVRIVARKDWDAADDEDDWDEQPVPSNKQLPNMKSTPDWYFAPCLFTGRRKQEQALPSRLLYADLDEIAPWDIKDVPPSIGWETSPGSYQAIWIMDRPLAVKKKDGSNGAFEDLNRRLTYHVGADKGGWSSTKVLRPPGSISTKYGKSRAKRFRVKIVHRDRSYSVQEMQQLLKEQPGSTVIGDRDWKDLPNVDDVLRRVKHKLPTRAKTLLRSTDAVGGDDRSARLWELHHLLLDAGLSPEEVLVIARQSAWNKYRGQRREMARLKTEIAKAVEVRAGQVVERGELERVRGGRGEGSSKASSGSVSGRGVRGKQHAQPEAQGVSQKLQKAYQSRAESVGLGYYTFNEFLEARFPEPQWLVEGFWSLGSYGVWAGEFKAYKTVTLLDFCLSVASGTPFLNRFKVINPGGVLYAHDEGTPGLIQNRLWRIASSKGLAAQTSNGSDGDWELKFPERLPHLHISTFPKLNLTEPESQQRLESYCGKAEPRVIVLESFYLMAQDVNEDKANEVLPALSFLKDLSKSMNVAVIVSHHYNKGSGDDGSKKTRPGLRMSGSSVFGRWYESAVYLERQGDDNENRTMIAAEHREQKGTGKMDLKVKMNVDDENHYEIEIEDADMKISSQGEDKVSPKDWPCPTCGANIGQRCKNEDGEYRAIHPSRKKRAGEGK